MKIDSAQLATCARFGVDPMPPRPHMMLGIALSRGRDLLPLNAVRHPPEGQGTGWFIWRGGGDATKEADDFFSPVHVEHARDHVPELLPYLAMPPGWAVVLAPSYEDVWFDEAYLVP